MNQLWLKILSATPDDLNKLVLALVVIASLIVGPILQWTIAKRQAADNVSAKRQNWIDELRRDAAECLAQFALLFDLNPKEDEHNELVRLLRVLSEKSSDPPDNETKDQREFAMKSFTAARDNVISRLQTILKERVGEGQKGLRLIRTIGGSVDRFCHRRRFWSTNCNI